MKRPKTNRDCPDTSTSHGTLRAVKHRGCICDGPGHQALAEARQIERARDRERNRIHRRTDTPPPPLPPLRPKRTVPGPPGRWTDLERRLLDRDDLPCRETDPELWTSDPEFKPTERAFRETIARAICGSCAWRLECLQVAIDIGDEWTLRGGMSPAERAEYKKAGAA